MLAVPVVVWGLSATGRCEWIGSGQSGVSVYPSGGAQSSGPETLRPPSDGSGAVAARPLSLRLGLISRQRML